MTTKVPSDNPITDPDDDGLGRREAASAFADQVLAIDAAEGLVVGVLGPWGSGKTSFINLARRRFAQTEVQILDFNPWMFSGTEQLVESFFMEVGAELKLRPGLGKLGDSIQDYGEAFSGLGWLPLIGATIERVRSVAKVLGKAMQRRREGTGSRRQKLREALAKLEQPIVIVLDDIDRLSSSEIREIFKLVRLTASFPNVIYVVAFDRGRVEEALGDPGTSGRAYLEKILQLAVDLPAVPFGVLTRSVTEALDAALEGVEVGGAALDNTWPDIFFEIIRPLIRNVRDVRRYVAAVHGSARTLAGHIALADLLALEAVRVFMPDVFAVISRSTDTLTATHGSGLGKRDDARTQEQVEAIVSADPKRADVTRSLITHLFPAAGRHVGAMSYGGDWKGQWLRNHRVAHEHHLHMYLERVASEGLAAFRDAERAWEVLDDRAALDAYLRSIDLERLEDVIGSLEAFQDQFSPDHAVPAITVLLNLLPDLPERHRPMFGFETRLVVGRVTYRLLKAIDGPAAVTAAVAAILPDLTTLGSKLELITDVGYRDGAGHRLVSEEDAAVFEREWRHEVRSTPAAELRSEMGLSVVLYHAKADAESDEPPLALDTSPETTAALLRSARTEVLGQTIGTRATRRSPRLMWPLLVDVCGGEDVLNGRIGKLRVEAPQLIEAELLALAIRYRDGWRPDGLRDTEEV